MCLFLLCLGLTEFRSLICQTVFEESGASEQQNEAQPIHFFDMTGVS